MVVHKCKRQSKFNDILQGFILETCPNPLNLKLITHFGDELPEDELGEGGVMSKSSVK